MKSSSKISLKKRNLRYLPLGFITIVILLAISWPVASRYIPDFFPERTYPLGDKLEYVGKSDYGCNTTIISFCDAKPASNYYYATGMNVREVMEYFSKGDSTSHVQSEITQEDKSINYVLLFTRKDGSTFEIDFYTNKQNLFTDEDFKKSFLKGGIEIGNKTYDKLKKSGF